MYLYKWGANRVKGDRYRQFLLVVKEALNKNVALLEQMEREIKPGLIVFYSLHTSVLESTSSVKYEIIDDLDLNKELDVIRYELIHIQHKLQIHTRTGYDPLFLSTPKGPEKRDELGKKITDHIGLVKPRIQNLLGKL
jgi:hypothetical protein